MKINRKQLRRLILREIKKINESPETFASESSEIGLAVANDLGQAGLADDFIPCFFPRDDMGQGRMGARSHSGLYIADKDTIRNAGLLDRSAVASSNDRYDCVLTKEDAQLIADQLNYLGSANEYDIVNIDNDYFVKLV